MTQKQLADLSGVSERAIGDIERGTVERPRRDTVRLLAGALRLTGQARLAFVAAAGRPVITGDLAKAWDELPGPPAALDGIVGRASEVARLRDLLASGEQRLVSVTGLAGVGKTRLAQEVAGELHTGHGLPVLWTAPPGVDSYPYLGPPEPRHSSHPARLVLDELLAAPDATGGELATVIGDRRAVLVLDGCELAGHQLSRVVALLRRCAGLRVLVTGREPTGERAGRTVPLGPLPVPATCPPFANELESVPSVQLLLQLVRQVWPGFALTPANRGVVAALCRQVDGIPAALAALARWFLVYDPPALLPRLAADPFGLIGSADEREADLRPLLCRAIGSLEDPERQALAALADVEASWSPATAARLAGGGAAEGVRLVQQLLQRGLIRPDGHPRHRRFVVLELVRWLRSAAPVSGASTKRSIPSMDPPAAGRTPLPTGI